MSMFAQSVIQFSIDQDGGERAREAGLFGLGAVPIHFSAEWRSLKSVNAAIESKCDLGCCVIRGSGAGDIPQSTLLPGVTP